MNEDMFTTLDKATLLETPAGKRILCFLIVSLAYYVTHT